MNAPTRSILLRQRFSTLFPASKGPISKATKKPVTQPLPPNHRPRVRPTYPYGAAMADHQVDWVREPDKRKRVKVEPYRASHGPSALTRIAGQLPRKLLKREPQ